MGELQEARAALGEVLLPSGNTFQLGSKILYESESMKLSLFLDNCVCGLGSWLWRNYVEAPSLLTVVVASRNHLSRAFDWCTKHCLEAIPPTFLT